MTSGERAAFIEYATRVLGSALDVCTLTRFGRAVTIDGVRLMGARSGRVDPVPLPGRDGELICEHINALTQLALPRSKDGRVLSAGRFEGTLDQLKFRGTWACEPPKPDEFTFSFPLPGIEPPQNLAGYLAGLLAALLEVFEFLEVDTAVVPDAVHIGDDVTAIIRLGSDNARLGSRTERDLGDRGLQPLHAIVATEPAILVLARHWGLLTSYLGISSESGVVEIGGISLRCNDDWLVDVSGDPMEIHQYLGRVCNVSCKFCYLYGNPTDMGIARGAKTITRSEIQTRLRYFDPVKRKALFRAQWEVNEVLVDPQLAPVLRELRQRSSSAFTFITNGNPLNPTRIDLLAEVKPVHLIVSINSLDRRVRSEVMGESTKQTDTALASLALLEERLIPYGLSLVALPEHSLDQLELTLEVIDAELSPAFVRINLPGFTRAHPAAQVFDTQTFWSEVVSRVQPMRQRLKAPILIIPSAFEENNDCHPSGARLLGCVTGSPAVNAGLKSGDLVTHVGGNAVESRAEAIGMLLLMRGSFNIDFIRNGVKRIAQVNADISPSYPYCGHVIAKYIMPWGCVFAPSLGSAEASSIRDVIDADKLSSVWILSSKIMIPAAADFVRRRLAEHADRIHFVEVRNEFLGGNIGVLDMATVGDMKRAIARELEGSSRAPDLILVSDTGFNREGRDLAGGHWCELERHFDLPVRLLSGTSRFPF